RSALAACRESATMSGLNSMPRAVAPRRAAVITVLPSPEPRSTSLSRGVSAAMSSMRSTRAWEVGTQMTSLPACPTLGSKGFAAGWAVADRVASVWASVWAPAAAPRAAARIAARYQDLGERFIVGFLHVVVVYRRQS